MAGMAPLPAGGSCGTGAPAPGDDVAPTTLAGAYHAKDTFCSLPIPGSGCAL